MSVEKNGEKFSGYNKPKRTPGAKKKFAVLAKKLRWLFSKENG